MKPPVSQENVSMPPAIIVLGATSDIGAKLVLRIASGHHVVLASRRPHDVEAELTAALMAAGAVSVESVFFDAADLPSHEVIIASVAEKFHINHVIVCFGILGDQRQAETNWQHVAEIATVDYTAQLVSVSVASDILLKQSGTGPVATITVFSSIAGWRARRANYVYGSTKAGLDAFCQGLADRLHGTNARIIIARPGFVIGTMTRGMTPAPMSVTADQVADSVSKILVEPPQNGGGMTIWIPGRLRILAWIMKLVPRPVWRRMPR